MHQAETAGRERAEELLRKSEEQFRRVVEQSTDGIILADEKGPIVEWNRGAFSVVAQSLHYLYSAGMLRRTEPELIRQENADKLAAHITEFSLAGLSAMRDRHKRNRQRRGQRQEKM